MALKFKKLLIVFACIAGLLTFAPASQASISYTYATLDNPNAPLGSTLAYGISDSGQVVGIFGGAPRAVVLYITAAPIPPSTFPTHFKPLPLASMRADRCRELFTTPREPMVS